MILTAIVAMVGCKALANEDSERFISEMAKAIQDRPVGTHTLTLTGTDMPKIETKLLRDGDRSHFVAKLKGKVVLESLWDGQRMLFVDRTKKAWLYAGDSLSRASKSQLDEGFMNVTLDTAKGLVVQINPNPENGRFGTRKNEEFLMADSRSASGEPVAMTFARDAVTKLPKWLVMRSDSAEQVWRFRYDARRPSERDLSIPAGSYRDYIHLVDRAPLKE